ncbi:MAG: DUF308 domain-containing protein [Eubacteriales bacterium]|nr:DUF308 domain-containing protein [Eubacteriales bacterium]
MRNRSGSRKIYAFGSLILGILLLIWPGSALKMASYVCGIVVMGGGITAILAHFRERRRAYRGGINLIAGIIVTAVGGWIFLNPENFASIIPTAIGYLIVLSGIVKLTETFSLTKAHYRKWWVSLLAGVVTIFMGMLLVNHAFGIVLTMVRIGGAFLLFNGISDLWISDKVDTYVYFDQKTSSNRRTGAGGGQNAAGYDTSDPDIIDAEDYREL